ncbi:MAG TPA: lysophospholipid acyltransferase family protein [Acidimicrobiales bacterium]|nr:lysophospholipid acyltransferase family protein [Acidimicrobiales bacterium]
MTAAGRTEATRLEGALGRVRRAGRALPRPTSALRSLDFPLRAPTVPGGVEPLPEEPRLGAAYDTAWARTPLARLGRLALLEGAVRPLVKVVADPERRGYDRLAGLDGPAIFAANHLSHLDAGLLLTSLPEPWRHRAFAGAAADYFFDGRAKATLAALALNAIPIERTKVTRRSAALAAELIEDGWSMVIFPEGGRGSDGWGQPFRAGAAFLSVRTGVPVVPVHLEGTGRILPKGTSKLVPGRTRVTFGAPLRPGPDEDMRDLSARIEAAVTALADEVAGDWWTARQRAHAGQSPPLSGPDAGAWRRAWALGDRRSHRGPARPPWPLRR